MSDLLHYYKKAKMLVDECTQPKLLKGAEHFGKCYTMPQVFILELYRKLGDALELRPAIEWQPIETAPKDGTQILVGAFDEGNSWCASDMWSGDGWLNHKKCKTLTHWMPMQQPRAKDKED